MRQLSQQLLSHSRQPVIGAVAGRSRCHTAGVFIVRVQWPALPRLRLHRDLRDGRRGGRRVRRYGR